MAVAYPPRPAQSSPDTMSTIMHAELVAQLSAQKSGALATQSKKGQTGEKLKILFLRLDLASGAREAEGD